MITIDLSPSQYRIVRSSVNSDSAVEGTVSSAARASRMSQSQANPAKAKAKAKLALLPDTHPIYGIVNLALLAVTIYLLWANFL